MPTIVDRETDARFWAQTGYKPNQRLDPRDPADSKMIPVWLDVYKKVKAEADAGRLVTTFDHPVVAQNLADAHVADQVAATNLDAAKATPDPTAKQQHVETAVHATTVSKEKTTDAAKVQPPTVAPQLVQEASNETPPPPPHARGKHHVAHAQVQAAHKPTPRGVLDKETNARFWAQTNYKPGQKLDMKDPTDAKMAQVWLDVFNKVKAEDDAGQLVLTYNHPVVAQNLADAQEADKVAADKIDVAVATPDPWEATRNVDEATIATQVSKEKTKEAAKKQPPTVDPNVAHAAPRMDPQAAIIRETYVRFWSTTHYKPGKALDPKDPQDARMAPIWMSIFEQVRREHTAPPRPQTARDHLAEQRAHDAGRHAAEVHHHHHKHRPSVKSTVNPRRMKDMREAAARMARGAGAPYVLVLIRPDGTPDQRTFASRAELDAEYAKLSEAHDQYQYVAAFDLGASPNAPVIDSVGTHAAEPETHAEETPPGETAPPTEKPSESPREAPSTGPSAGKIGAIVAGAFVLLGGIAYAASRGGRSKFRNGARSSRTKVVVAAVPSAAPAVSIGRP